MNLFDAHCHLQDARLAEDRAGVLSRARAVGVDRIAIKGASEADWSEVEVLIESDAFLYPSFGLHPWFLKQRSSAWAMRLNALLEKYPQAGVGEIGIDPEPKGNQAESMEVQEEVFLAQLEMAQRWKRPVSIHCRGAWGRLLEVLDRTGPLPDGWMIHCFGGSKEVALELLRRGAYLSFSGTITRPKNRKAAEVLPCVPAERLLLETDAPDLLPVGVEGPHNEPGNLRIILARAAFLRGESEAEVASMTYQNTCRLFVRTWES